jgi:hypothetical protein
MRKLLSIIVAGVLVAGSAAMATQADDTAVVVLANTAGPTPFISNVTITVSNPDALANVLFTVQPKANSLTRAVKANYKTDYLVKRGFYNAQTGELTLPVFGLYANYQNTVSLTFFFSDHSSKATDVAITTAPYDDGGCTFNTPTVRQARSSTTDLSFDFILVASSCDTHQPTLLDTDGEIRWVGTYASQKFQTHYQTQFADNAIYLGDEAKLIRIELDGAATEVADYTNDDVVSIHHNIDFGKSGLLLGVDTADYIEAVVMEVDLAGNILHRWDFGDIISKAMIAGGDDPSGFVRKVVNGDYSFSSPSDWFHNNANAYRAADNSLIVSSRENFIIAVDYDTKAIKWILGDKTKDWYVNYPSLRQFALDLGPNTTAPTGEHAISISKSDGLLMMDNGTPSQHHVPAGPARNAFVRQYRLDLQAKIATESYTYATGLTTPFCSSVYEDAPHNYMLDYAVVGGINADTTARLLALTPTGEKVFEYSYPSGPCNVAYRSLPIHLERLQFTANGSNDSESAVLHQRNMSARSLVMGADNVGIAGFIITGNEPKDIAIRALGPSLPIADATTLLQDPTLELHDKAGNVIEFNNNYTDGPFVDALNDAGLIPGDNREAAILRKQLPPGEYTAVMRGLNDGTGIGLVEVYDLSANSDSKLGNLSSRAFISTGDNVLIGGVIVQGGFPQRLLFRALGPELQVPNPLQDTTLDLYNKDGAVIASNDDWMDSPDAADIQDTGVAPTDPKESAILVPLDAGVYTAIVRGKDNSTGIGLLESYQRALKE